MTDISTVLIGCLVAVAASVITHFDSLRSIDGLRQSFRDNRDGSTGPSGSVSVEFLASHRHRLQVSLVVAAVVSLLTVLTFLWCAPAGVTVSLGTANLLAVLAAGLVRCWMVPLLSLAETGKFPESQAVRRLELVDYLPKYYLHGALAGFLAAASCFAGVLFTSYPEAVGLTAVISVLVVLIACGNYILAPKVAAQPIFGQNKDDWYWGERAVSDQLASLLVGVFWAGLLFSIFAFDPTSGWPRPEIVGLMVAYFGGSALLLWAGYRELRSQEKRRWQEYVAAEH